MASKRGNALKALQFCYLQGLSTGKAFPGPVRFFTAGLQSHSLAPRRLQLLPSTFRARPFLRYSSYRYTHDSLSHGPARLNFQRHLTHNHLFSLPRAAFTLPNLFFSRLWPTVFVANFTHHLNAPSPAKNVHLIAMDTGGGRDTATLVVGLDIGTTYVSIHFPYPPDDSY